WTCAALCAVLLGCVVIALKLGAVPISVTDLVWNLGRVAIGRSDQLPSEYSLIVFDLRLPRILLGILVGASLSVAGASFQALLRNPLADPFVLGISGGAGLGAILAQIAISHLTIPAALSALLTPLGAFAGALITILVVYLFGHRNGQMDSGTLLLGGVITASFLSAMIMFLLTTVAGRDLHGTAFWLMGDLSTPMQKTVAWIVRAGFFVAAGMIYTTAPDLNLLLAGEKEAMHLGVDVKRVRVVVYVAASVLTGLAVSVSGAIGYIGLLVPHAMRSLFGSDHRMLIPTCAFGGAIAVVVADALARTV